MSYRVYITADFDDEATAKSALSDMEEVVGKANGDLMDSDIEDNSMGPSDVEIYGAGV